VYSLGANAAGEGSVNAPAARLTQSLKSKLEGRRDAVVGVRRSSDDAPPRQVGVIRRAWRPVLLALRAGRRREIWDNMATTSCVGAGPMPSALVPSQAQLPCQRFCAQAYSGRPLVGQISPRRFSCRAESRRNGEALLPR
jgi:hypothetical protein